MIRRRPSRFSGFKPLSKKKDKRHAADGYVFDSGPEFRMYGDLKLLLDHGTIKDLEVHPIFRFIIKDPSGTEINCGRFHADFAYIEVSTGKRRVLDCKAWARNPKSGQMEPVVDSDYTLRINLVRALYGVTVETI